MAQPTLRAAGGTWVPSSVTVPQDAFREPSYQCCTSSTPVSSKSPR